MSWVESVSPSFSARHEERDADDAARVLEQLEHARDELGRFFEHTPGEIAVVLHGSDLQLGLAHPLLPFARLATAPAARRYLVGWPTLRELHVLAPRLLAQRASNVPGSLEMLMLAPVALYARLVVAANARGLPPPHRPGTVRRWLRRAWLVDGAAQHLSGQTAHARPAIARRLKEGPEPDFPPRRRDATLLGGTVLDLVARARGAEAAARLAVTDDDPLEALVATFDRPASVVEAAWRDHLERMAGPG